MTTSPSSDVPSFDINRVLRVRAAILGDVDIACYVGSKPEGRDYEYLVRAFRARLPGSDLAAVRRSLLQLTGQPITRARLEETAWRLAGNVPLLRAGVPVSPWSRQPHPEWVPLQIVDSRLWVTKRGRRGGMFQFRVMAGTPCPLLIDKFWTREFCGLASRRMGFTKLRGKYPFQHIAQLVGMRLVVRLSPERSREQPDFDELAEAKGAILSHNRRLLKARSPLHRRCPHDYPTSQACHLCPMGMDRCDLATHRATYVFRYCRACQKDAWLDPATAEPICIDCQYKRVRELQGQQGEQ